MFKDLVFGRNFRLFRRLPESGQLAVKVDGRSIRMAEDGTLSAGAVTDLKIDTDHGDLVLYSGTVEISRTALPTVAANAVSADEGNLLSAGSDRLPYVGMTVLLQVLAEVVNRILQSSTDTFGFPAGPALVETDTNDGHDNDSTRPVAPPEQPANFAEPPPHPS